MSAIILLAEFNSNVSFVTIRTLALLIRKVIHCLIVEGFVLRAPTTSRLSMNHLGLFVTKFQQGALFILNYGISLVVDSSASLALR